MQPNLYNWAAFIRFDQTGFIGLLDNFDSNKA